MLASLHNYLSNEADRARRNKRGGKAEFVYIDLEEAEDRYGLEPVEGLTPEKDLRCALGVGVARGGDESAKPRKYGPGQSNHLPSAEMLKYFPARGLNLAELV